MQLVDIFVSMQMALHFYLQEDEKKVRVATIDILEVWTITWYKYNNTGSLDGILEGQ